VKGRRAGGKEGELCGILFDDNALNKIYYKVYYVDAIRDEDNVMDNYSS